jgi:hypothetical protein
MNTLFLLLILFFVSRQIKDKTAIRCIYLLMGLLAFNYLYDGYCNFEDPGAGYQIKSPEATCELNPAWATQGLGDFDSDATATTLEQKQVSCRTRITGVPGAEQQDMCTSDSTTTSGGVSVSECIYTSPTCDQHDNPDDCIAEDGCFFVAGSSDTSASCNGSDDGTGTEATCTGSNDGTGTACVLNADGNACAVEGGVCVFTGDTAGAACSLNTEGDACAVQGGDCTYTPESQGTDASCRTISPGLTGDRISPGHLERSYMCASGYEGSPSLMMKESISGGGAPWATVAENYGTVERQTHCNDPGVPSDNTALMTLGGCNEVVEVLNETCATAKSRLGDTACGQVGWKYDTDRADLTADSRLVAGNLDVLTCGSEMCDITAGAGADAQKCCKEKMPCYMNERVNPNNSCLQSADGESIVAVSPPSGFNLTEVPYGLDISSPPTMGDWSKLSNQLCRGKTCELSSLGNQDDDGPNDRDICCQESFNCKNEILSDDYFDNLNLDEIKKLLNNNDLCNGIGSMDEMKERAEEAINGVEVAAISKTTAGEEVDLDKYCDTLHTYDKDTGQCCFIGTFGGLGCDGPSLKVVSTTNTI